MNSNLISIGVDPGTNGGAALFSGLDLWDVLSFKFDPEWQETLKRWLLAYEPAYCLFEQVGSRPGQGVKSMFTFGKAAGEAELVLRFHARRYDRVVPQVWQKEAGLRYEYPRGATEAQRRAIRTKTQKRIALERYPGALRDVKGDVYGAVLIGEVAAKRLLAQEAKREPCATVK